MILILGALLGLFSVVFGAYAEHALKQSVSAPHFAFLLTALRYNQIHAVIIVAIGLIISYVPQSKSFKLLRYSGGLFITGTILFCFSIYLAVALNLPELLHVTPVGGVVLILAWLMLLITGCVRLRQK